MEAQGELRPCCQDLENREEPIDLGNGLQNIKCSVCHANHYVLSLDAGDLRGEGADIG